MFRIHQWETHISDIWQKIKSRIIKYRGGSNITSFIIQNDWR